MRPMRTLIRLGVAATCAGLAGLAACSGGGSNGSGAGDAGEQDAPFDQSVLPTDSGPVSNPDVATVVPEASVHNCILRTADGGAADPVLLCSQETALLNLLTNAYTTGTGVAPGFGSQPPYTASTGHAWQDDLGLAASLGAFQCSALAYGDTMYLGMFDAVLTDLGKLLPGEVVTAGSYGGELYFRLRNAARGFSLIGSASVASALDAMADGYARAIQTGFVQSVQLQSPDAGALDAGATTATLIGVLDTQNGTVSYAPAQAAMAAAALLDMAARATASGDAGAQAAAFAASGSGALAYLWARARDPVTGLFYQALVTSGDAGHDQLGTGTYANDALLSDVQASVVLALARAQTAANALAGDGGSGQAPYAAQIETLVTALTSAGLFNGVTMMPQGTVVLVPGAWMQGLVPSLGLTLTNQTTASNALLLGGYTRAEALGVATQWGWEVVGLGLALDFASPSGAPWPANSNLVSVVTDGLGDVTQVAYLTAVSKGWGWARAFSPSGGDAGLDPDATSYSTAAVNAMVEGVTQGWYATGYGLAGQPGVPCGY
jgi:hypothetical protein